MIAIIGCGTLGSRVARLLQDKELLLIDHDVIEKKNVDIQLYEREDVGKKKALVLAEHLDVEHRSLFIDRTNVSNIQEAEAVVDCTDNLLTRELLGAYCYKEGIPLIHGAAARDRGIAALFDGKPCLASLYSGKISVDDCRSTDIDLEVAQKVAEAQARLVQLALEGEGHDGVHIITPNEENVVKLSEESHEQCTGEIPQGSHYITYCEQARCLAAKPLKKMEVKPRTGTHEGIRYRVLGNGEIHFLDETEIDLVKKISRSINAF